MELAKVKTNNQGSRKVVNIIINSNRDNTTNKLQLLSDGGSILSIPRDIVNGFNKYFMEVGPNLSTQISNSRGSIYKYFDYRYKNSSYLKEGIELEF